MTLIFRRTTIAMIVGLSGLLAWSAQAADPSVLGRLKAIDGAHDVEVYENKMFVATDSGVEVFSVTQKGAPRLVGFYGTRTSVLDLAVRNEQYLYLIHQDSDFLDEREFEVLDVSDPTRPVSVLTLPESYWYGNIVLAGNQAYVYQPGFSNSVTVLDISSPAAPRVDHRFLASGTVMSMQWDGANLVMNTFSGGSPAASYPTTIRVVSTASTHETLSSFEASYWAARVAAFWRTDGQGTLRRYAAVADSDGLEIYDTTDPRAATFKSTLVSGLIGTSMMAVRNEDNPSSGSDNSGSILYLSGGDITAVDVSDPVNVVVRGTFSNRGTARNLAIWGSHLYVISSKSVVVIDAKSPESMLRVGSVGTKVGFTSVVQGSGTTVFSGAGKSGLFSVELSDPANPTVVGVYDTPGDVAQMLYSVVTRRLYVADKQGGLLILDAADPRKLKRLGTYKRNSAGYTVTDVTIRGRYVFLAADGQLEVLDALNPRKPTFVSRTSRGFVSGALTVERDASGTLVYVGDQYREVHTFDVRNVRRPVEVASMVPAKAVDLFRHDGLLYVSSHTKGLDRYSIDGDTLKDRWNYDQKGTVHQIVATDDRAYLANGTAGTWVLAANNPGSQTLFGIYDRAGNNAKGLALQRVGGTMRLVVAESTGLTVLDVTGI